MENIDLDNCLFIFDEGEICAIYKVKHTVKDIKKALEDCGDFSDYDEETWESMNEDFGVKSVNDIAKCIINDGSFQDDERTYTTNANFIELR